jgi:hypothetical protein
MCSNPDLFECFIKRKLSLFPLLNYFRNDDTFDDKCFKYLTIPFNFPLLILMSITILICEFYTIIIKFLFKYILQIQEQTTDQIEAQETYLINEFSSYSTKWWRKKYDLKLLFFTWPFELVIFIFVIIHDLFFFVIVGLLLMTFILHIIYCIFGDYIRRQQQQHQQQRQQRHIEIIRIDIELIRQQQLQQLQQQREERQQKEKLENERYLMQQKKEQELYIIHKNKEDEQNKQNKQNKQNTQNTQNNDECIIEIDSDNVNIPDEFLCPISLGIMQNPYITIDGNSYEYTNIVKWILENKNSPYTRESLKIQSLIPNYSLKNLIEKYLSDSNYLKTIPEEFICPLTKNIMEEPCITGDGFTYEKQALIKHNYNGNMIKNRAIKNLIEKYTFTFTYI